MSVCWHQMSEQGEVRMLGRACRAPCSGETVAEASLRKGTSSILHYRLPVSETAAGGEFHRTHSKFLSPPVPRAFPAFHYTNSLPRRSQVLADHVQLDVTVAGPSAVSQSLYSWRESRSEKPDSTSPALGVHHEQRRMNFNFTGSYANTEDHSIRLHCLDDMNSVHQMSELFQLGYFTPRQALQSEHS